MNIHATEFIARERIASLMDEARRDRLVSESRTGAIKRAGSPRPSRIDRVWHRTKAVVTLGSPIALRLMAKFGAGRRTLGSLDDLNLTGRKP